MFFFFTKMRMVKLQQSVSVLVHFFFFFPSKMATSLRVNKHCPCTSDLCRVLEPSGPADDTVIQYLLAYWQSVNSGLCVKVGAFIPNCYNSVLNLNSRVGTGRMMENEWMRFYIEEFFFLINILLGNIMRMLFPVNVPCILKWAAQS